MILESLVTTMDAVGRINIAPMGPIVRPPSLAGDRPSFLLRPYDGSTTCANLLSTRRAVVHVVDDVLLLARAAIGRVDAEGLVCPLPERPREFARLIDCHRWFAVEIHEIGGIPPRHELGAECVAEGTVRPFFGFNRAKHAVIEAAILATRIGLVDDEMIRDEMRRLRSPVEKTAGPDEREAFALIESFIEGRLGATP